MTKKNSSTVKFIVTEHNNGHVAFCETIEQASYEAAEFQKSAPRNSDSENFTIHTRQEWLDIIAEDAAGEEE